MKHTPICFSIKYSEEIPKCNNIVSFPEQPRKRTKVLRLLFLYSFLRILKRKVI
nr:MAG TPA: hypothetical protein [Caudoviricetes sp.]